MNIKDKEGDFHEETYMAVITVCGPCACDACDWTGDAAELADIEDCALDPGDASPAGRCPECDSLAYPVKPEPVAPVRAQVGPWAVTEQLANNDELIVMDVASRAVIAGVWPIGTDYNEDDDGTATGPCPIRAQHAALIAQAPAMLKALERLTHPAADDSDLDNALAVIRAARGVS